MSKNLSHGERRVTLIELLRRTSRRMVEEITERMEANGFPNSPARHYPVFENIDPKGTRITVLAARAGITHQSMTQLVDELEARSIVERVADPSDGRARLVRLTAQGRARVKAALREIAAIERHWSQSWADAGLGGDHREAFEAALREPVESP
jgi:DNA-binding MarR family transcriptional regulator